MDDWLHWLRHPWGWLVVGYVMTIAVEMPILVIGLSREHSIKRRLAAGAWLTACTYPIVVIVLPYYFNPYHERFAYLAVAETFAPIAECVLFWAAFGPLRHPWRDLAVVTLANLASFGVGELVGWLLVS
jgi:hypothetical protein